MSLRLEAIRFNHDSSSATVDAFNIRKNEREFVEPPEWRRGASPKPKPEDSPAAYARCETQENTLTIKANFSFDGSGELDIRALDANLHREPLNGPNLSQDEVKLFEDLIINPAGNVLGEVEAESFRLNSGESGFQSFDLGSVRIWDAGVGVHDIVWRWQFHVSGSEDWIDFAITTHRIYTVLNVPREPWLQEFNPGNTQLPWVEVLDHACDWARGAQDTDDAAARITVRVHNFGHEKLLRYSGSASYTDEGEFDCSSFLAVLKDKLGKGDTVNCDDCAAIVSTFANSVGCDLAQMCISPFGKSIFGLKPHLRIGKENIHENRAFFHHQVASEGGCGEDVEVFDACLQIADNKTEPSIFSLPTNLAFSMGKSGYHFRLVVDADQPITHPHPDCKRRRLGPATGFSEACVIRPEIEKYFEFPLWKESNVSGKRYFFSDFFFAQYIVSPLQIAGIQETPRGSIPRSIHSFWRSPSQGEQQPFRIDCYETASWKDAREGVMKVLAALAEPSLVRHKIEGLGDVTFADPAFENILFAAGNLVFYLRNLGDKVRSLIDVGRNITEKILNPPPIVIYQLVPPDAVKRFRFIESEGAVNKKTRIREEPANPLAPPPLYQFEAEAGVVSREDGQIMYRPESAGIHTVEIFAADEQGNAVKQTLQLLVHN